jgi:NAD kinase
LPNDTNKLLQQEIDIIYAFGGDGTLLNLLKAVYTYYSKNEVPPIAAFNMVS